MPEVRIWFSLTLPCILQTSFVISWLSCLQEFKGYVFKIMGGCDKQGFPMKQGVLTTGRVHLLLHGVSVIVFIALSSHLAHCMSYALNFLVGFSNLSLCFD